MEPLFAAVAHGCQADEPTKVWEEVYWKRIRRGNEHYSMHKLGAFGADLAALSNLFDAPWHKPAAGLSEHRQALVLNLTGFGLRALGRLAEASHPMQAGVEASAQKEDWVGAAQDAGNLSELYLTMGEVSQAVASARQSVDFADRSREAFEKVNQREKLGNALHQSGSHQQAEKLFREAERIQNEQMVGYLAFLYSIGGFVYCDLLLSQGQYQEVQKRARQTIEIAKRNHRLLDIALDKLSLGRAFLLEATARAVSGHPSPRLSAASRGRLAGSWSKSSFAARLIRTRRLLSQPKRFCRGLCRSRRSARNCRTRRYEIVFGGLSFGGVPAGNQRAKGKQQKASGGASCQCE